MPIISVHNADYLRRAVVSHKTKVKSLYKRAVRDLEAWVLPDRRSLLRGRFEENKDLKDLRVAKLLVQKGEDELWATLHPKPMKFTYSPGGICFERYYTYPDWHLDLWHPIEKAQYPEYFARREQMKDEYVKLWELRYKKEPIADLGITGFHDYNTEPVTDEEKKYGRAKVDTGNDQSHRFTNGNK